MKPEAMPWAGILISPMVWFVSLESNFALAPLACSGGGKLFLYLVSGISLILVALAGSMSFASRSRRRAMATAGVGLSALSFLVIVAQTIPNLLLAGCE